MDKKDQEATRVNTQLEQTELTELETVVETVSDQLTARDATDEPTEVTDALAQKKKRHHVLKPGTLIKNRFSLEREIGHGGMGVVYTARDLRKEEMGDKDSIIAIKLLTQKLKAYPKALRMLQQETKKSQGLAHPNIVTVYDFDRDHDTFYMTMEYLTGQTLKEYIKKHQRQPDDMETVLPIIQGMVEGLSYAHKKSIIHSDLKPANVFLTTEGVVKILDFGIARAMMEPEVAKQKKNTSQSGNKNAKPGRTQKLVGLTPNFASPEMFEGKPPSPADDIYALSCITYYLLTGKHPYENVPADLAIKKALVPARVEGLNDRQWGTLLSGLELDGEKRIASVDEFLTGFLPKKKEVWRWVALGSLLVASVIFAYYTFRPTPEFDIFVNPPPEPPMTAAIQEQVETSLELAEVHRLVGRLISPPGSNALDKYTEVLDIHPYDRQAIDGLRIVLDTLAEQAEQAVKAGNVDDAAALVDTGLSVYGQHKNLLALKDRLKVVK